MPRRRRRVVKVRQTSRVETADSSESEAEVASELEAMAGLKVDGFMKSFGGRRDESFDDFWLKFSVLSDVNGWDTDAKRMQRLPLFLDGDALLVFSKMDTNDKKDQGKVSKLLKKSFTVSGGEAYKLFTSRKLLVDESPEAYVSDLQRLLTASGHKVTGDKDAIVVEQLLTGLPFDYAKEIRLTSAGKELTVTDCVDKLRALSLVKSAGQPMGVSGAVMPGAGGKKSGVLCHHCGEPGHIRRNCPQRRSGTHGNGSTKFTGSKSSGQKVVARSDVACFFCEQKGHYQQDCELKKKWLREQAKSGASSCGAVVEDDAACLLATVSTQQATLPRVYAEVAVPGVEEWQRAKAIIDTGSCRTLISEGLVNRLSVSPVPAPGKGIVALDGNYLDTRGTVEILLKRCDGPVLITESRITAVVLPDLNVVSSDVLIGSDFVTACGGLHLDYDEGKLTGVVIGPASVKEADVTRTADEAPSVVGAAHTMPKIPRHVKLTEDANTGDVELSTSDGTVRWKSAPQFWEVSWKWSEATAPEGHIGSGVSEYSRRSLSCEQEDTFCEEVDGWIEKGWLIPHDPDVHGEAVAVLPLLAVKQEHKVTTPVRPCLDYTALNKELVSNPGAEAPACQEKLRQWRGAGEPDGYVLIDIRKAYLQVHVSPDLWRYQVIKWKGRTYVLTRMGFGLAVAPKMMDLIVRYSTRQFPRVDNYIDDLHVPKEQLSAVVEQLEEYGLPTKPAEDLTTARVLGLQLTKADDGEVTWSRRDGPRTALPDELTRRAVYKWCGALTSHYPVASWLRVHCSWLKRLTSLLDLAFDDPLPDQLKKFCIDLAQRLTTDDPVRGVWQGPSGSEDPCVVWCDASDIAYGAALEYKGSIVEDCCWLRKIDDKHHINLSELDAAVEGINLAVQWGVTQIQLKTDSKTVASWLQQLLANTRRVKTSGLHSVLIQRRLQVVEETVALLGLNVEVVWVPTADNKADQLTRVPQPWTQYAKSLRKEEADVTATALTVSGPVTLEQIAVAQRRCANICQAKDQLAEGKPVTVDCFKKVNGQLLLEEGVLYRSVKLPVDGEVAVPVIPESLQGQLVSAVHTNSGHANWQTMHSMLRAECYFPSMSKACQDYVSRCSVCVRASAKRSPVGVPVRPDIPGKPWSEIVIDTLELGTDHSGRYRCVLVIVDAFTKWADAIPLVHHDAKSVAEAVTKVCLQFGAPEVVRMDNGTEFANAVVGSLFRVFGTRVRTGAVYHPQSQGTVERMNRTLLTMIRKVLDRSSDWKADLEVLLFYYRTRPHATTGFCPMEVMFGWLPRHLLIEKDTEGQSLSSWVSQLASRASRIRDLVEEELSRHDACGGDTENPYGPGDRVMMLRPQRQQKRLPPYEDGWTVTEIVSSCTVRIRREADGFDQVKTVNVSLIKPDHSDIPEATADDVQESLAEPVLREGLRSRESLVPPARYRSSCQLVGTC